MRTLNSKNTENKYILLFYDWIEKDYKIIGKFASLKAISIYLDINYNIVTQIHKGKSICYKKFLLIERI